MVVSLSSSPNPLLRPVLDGIWAFSPNRHTLGGTAYLLQHSSGLILIDCPPASEEIWQLLDDQGGVRHLILTHRGAIAQVNALQSRFHCQVWIQEQEAYLLPDVEVTPFQQGCHLAPDLEILWTPGHTPGTSCVYSQEQGGILFTGRHLLPNHQGDVMPLRIARTFHWGRQLRSVQRLRDRFSPDTLRYLCPGANLGFLRGHRYLDRAWERLMQLDLAALQHRPPGL